MSRLKKVSGVSATVSGAAGFGFFARAGQSYRIAVDGAGGASGSVSLRVKSWSGTPASKADWKSLWKKVERDDDHRKHKGDDHRKHKGDDDRKHKDDDDRKHKENDDDDD